MMQFNMDIFNANITMFEVARTRDINHLGKVHGIDDILTECLKSQNVISAMHKIFTVCFITGNIPSQ